MKKIFETFLVFLLISIAVASISTVCILSGISKNSLQRTVGSTSNMSSNPTFLTASSTSFALTTTSQRLLATSSATRRVAARFVPTNCTNGSATYVAFNADVPATVTNSTAVLASTSMSLSDYPENPIVQGAVTGVVPTGTCTVLVTEWLSKY